MSELKLGLYEHYKHNLYWLYGQAQHYTAAVARLGHWDVLGMAHYSEESSTTLDVYAAGFEVSGPQFAVSGLQSHYPPDQRFAVYRALYGDASIPRLAVRPWDGDNGFITPTRHGMDRFWPVPENRKLVPLADRHDFDGDYGLVHGVDQPICRACLLPVSV